MIRSARKPVSAPPTDPGGGGGLSSGDGFEGIDVEVARVADAVDRRVSAWRDAGCSIGLVPALGEPHVGHLQLISIAASECEKVVVAAPADADVLSDTASLRLLSTHGADLLYLTADPLVEGDRPGTRLSDDPCLPGLVRDLESRFDADGFEKALSQLDRWAAVVRPDRIYQTGARYQVALSLARLLAAGGAAVSVRVVETARGPGGITPAAEIDRLGSEDRDRVAALQRIVMRIAQRIGDGASTPEAETAWGRDALRSAGISAVDYLEVREPDPREPAKRLSPAARIFVAARIGDTRLVDSIPVAGPAGITTLGADR